ILRRDVGVVAQIFAAILAAWSATFVLLGISVSILQWSQAPKGEIERIFGAAMLGPWVCVGLAILAVLPQKSKLAARWLRPFPRVRKERSDARPLLDPPATVRREQKALATSAPVDSAALPLSVPGGRYEWRHDHHVLILKMHRANSTEALTVEMT